MKTAETKKTIGILGGMGPEATAHFFNLIVRMTRASQDSDHIPLVIINNPRIPDRTQAIVNKGKSPLPDLIRAARKLEQAGADFIVMPCITAHYYYPEIIKHINISFIHMIKEVANFIQTELPDIHNFGLLSTTGTIKTELFQKEIANTDRHIIIPDPEQQKKVMDAVYGKKGIKAGHLEIPREKLSEVRDHLKKKGAEAIITGCTEISFALEDKKFSIPLINSLQILAITSIQKAGYQISIK